MKKQIRVYDIKWYYNYQDHTDQPKEEYDSTFNAEPTEMIVDVTDWDFIGFDDVDSIEKYLSNYISDESGYYHEGFKWEWVKEETIQGVITKPIMIVSEEDMKEIKLTKSEISSLKGALYLAWKESERWMDLARTWPELEKDLDSIYIKLCETSPKINK